MTAKRPHFSADPFQVQHKSSSWKSVLFSLFLSFGLAAPSASATCLSNVAAAHRGAAIVLPPQALSANTQSTAHTDSSFPNSIVGLWHTTFSSSGEVVDVAFDAFNADGNETLNDFTDPIEGNVCLGTWEQTALHSYVLKHPSWSFDDTGKLIGTVVISEWLTLSPNGLSYTGTYKFAIYDLNGKFVEDFTGKLKGTRITAR